MPSLLELGGNAEMLQCARYGEVTELIELLNAGASVNYAEELGNSTALHYAAANGHHDCVAVLLKAGAKVTANKSGNSPLHWAAQNKHFKVFQLLCEPGNDIDVLAKNSEGKSALTFAFASGNTEMAKVALAHDSAAELEDDNENSKATVNKDGSIVFKSDKATEKTVIESNKCMNTENSMDHVIQFTSKSAVQKSNKKTKLKKGPSLKIRELAINDRTENIFKTEAIDDKTGLGLWPASVVLSHWLVDIRRKFKNSTIAELGAGCGLAGIVAARYTKASHVVITDRYDVTVANLRHNVDVNCNEAAKGKGARTDVKSVDWADDSAWGDWGGKGKRFDAVIGADLVYHKDVISIFLSTINSILKPGGSFYYVSQENRGGLIQLLEQACTFLFQIFLYVILYLRI